MPSSRRQTARRAAARCAAVLVALLACGPARAVTIVLGSTVTGVVDNADSNALNGSKITVGAQSAAVISLSVYVGAVDTAPNNQYSLAIYSDAGGAPSALLVAAASGTLSANAWNTLPVSAALAPNTSYWLIYNSNGRTAAVNNMYFSTGASGQGAFNPAPMAYGTWPASFGTATLTTAVYALYATAETSGVDPRATLGEWSPVMNWPLIAIHANLLKTGKVLVWDEQESVTQPKLWDPTTQAFTDTPLVGSELFCSGHTQLADGQVFVAGGHEPHEGEAGTNFTYQYLPDSNTWVPTGDMVYDRWYPAVTKLGDGRVAIFSGQMTENVFANTPEMYDPADGATDALTTISTPQIWEEEYPANFLLPDGQVLAISPEHRGVHLFGAQPVSWTPINTTPIRLGSAVQYRPGRILMTGGGTGFFANSLGQAGILDMTAASPAWRSTTSMSIGRYMHNLVMLPTGNVLAIGGSAIVNQQDSSGQLPIEQWNPESELWTTLAALSVPRMYHSTALLLPDGRVLSAGGGHNGNAPNYYSAQIYSPPYLFRGARPVIASAPAAIAYGEAFTVDSPQAAGVAKISLTALSASTHATDMNQHYAELAFSRAGNQLLVTPPANGDQAPPGYYMLFIVDADGVPSVARIVKVGEAQNLACSEMVTRPRLVLRRMNTAPGDDRLLLQGSIMLASPFSPPLDPSSTGVRLTLSHGSTDVADIAIPGGAFADPPGAGWKSHGSQWTYVNHSAAPPGGIVKVVVKGGSSAPGLIRVRAIGIDGDYGVDAGDLPLSWQVVLSPPVGHCGTAQFPGPAPAPRCRMSSSGSTVTCK